jgi:threonine synthase
MTHRSDPSPSSTWITLATAHPAKFSAAVELALSPESQPDFNFDRDVLPEELAALGKMKKRIHKVKGEQGVRELIEKVKKGEQNTSQGLGSI